MNDLVRACADLRNLAKNTQDTRVKAEIYKTFIDIYCVIKSLPSEMFGQPEDNAISAIMERLEDHEERLSELEDNTGAFDPVTDVPGVAELMWKVAEETDDKELKKNIWCSFIDHGEGVTEFPGGVSIDEACENLQRVFGAENGTDLESAQYDDESDGYKYSAAEIAQKFNVLSQYCDIELKDTCTVKDIANFLEHVELDASGNVWLNLQVDERTIKRFRLNREFAGQIQM